MSTECRCDAGSGDGRKHVEFPDRTSRVFGRSDVLLSRIGYFISDADRIATERKLPSEVMPTEWGWLRDFLIEVETALTGNASTDRALPDDVVALVIAARTVAFLEVSPETIRALDKASEAFASRVPWEGEPEPVLNKDGGAG